MLPRSWRSPILRLALTHATAFLIAFLILGSAGYFTLSAITDEAMERTVRRDLADLRDWYGEGGERSLHDALADRVNDNNDVAFYLLASGNQIQQVPASLVLPSNLIKQAGWHHFTLDVGDVSRPALAKVEIFPDGSRLLVGHIAWERERLDSAMHRELGAGLLLVLLMAASLAAIMSRAIAHALAGPLAVAGRFAEGELHPRVTPNASGDSFDRLALTLNAMFARIEDLVNGIAHATDAIAHDLRTPLTRLRTQLEGARSATRDDDTVAATAIEVAINETDKLLATFQALLRLARIEADTQRPDNQVDMAALVQDAGELFEALAEAKNQTLKVSVEPAQLRGDRDQLFQLLVNLLDNAVKYSPAGSLIRLSLRTGITHLLLMVSDEGPGIAHSDRERVFDRFVRLEAHRGTPGNGLGLALVRAIVRHHGGRIRLEDAAPGLRVMIELPLEG